jgi:uncharacterized membrane protein
LLRTLKPLLVRPGYLTNEFSAGRRANYVSPVRLYLVVSLVFFFLLSILGSAEVTVALGEIPAEARLELEEEFDADEGLQRFIARMDEEHRENFLDALASRGMDRDALSRKMEKIIAGMPQEAATPRTEFESMMAAKAAELIVDPQRAYESAMDSLPATLFVMLPLSALLLKLFYPRRFYSEHLVFSIHLHTFFFIVLTLMLFVPDSDSPVAGVIWESLGGLLGLSCFAYAFVAMKVTYRQSIVVTAAKYAMILMGDLVLVSVGVTVMAVVTLWLL